MYREVELVRIHHKLVAKPTHRIATPTSDGVVEYRARLVGNNQILVNARNLAPTLTLRAGTQRIVEREEVLVRSLELDAVSREVGVEESLFALVDNYATACAIAKCLRYRLAHTG